MSAPRIAVLATIAVLALTGLSSCGGGDDASSSKRAAAPIVRPERVPAAVVARANRNCRQMLRDVKRVGRAAVRTEYSNTLELATEGFAKPGLRLMRWLAKRQQALEPSAGNTRFSAYADLFDPIIVLAKQGLSAGRAGDRSRSEQLRDLLTGLGEDQREAARRAGLRDCDVDFLDALVRGATG
jgi:hypothetical protein